jgi:hypothetical protein
VHSVIQSVDCTLSKATSNVLLCDHFPVAYLPRKRRKQNFPFRFFHSSSWMHKYPLNSQ